MNTLLKILLVDQDELVLEQMQSLDYGNHSIYEISDTIDTLDLAIPIIESLRPDIILMDATNNNLNTLKKLTNLNFLPPKLIFMSEDKHKAYEVFKYKALFFVLKPLNPNDILASIYTVKKHLEMELAFQNEKINEINSINNLYNNKELISIASLDKIDLVKVANIVYCQADGKYTEFILKDGTRMVSSKNIGEYQDKLENSIFFRIHHSYIINIHYVEKITKKDGYYCQFTNGDKLPIAKRRQDGFTKFINL